MSAALSKDEQSERTRRALIGVARDMFTEQGYAQTATEELVQRAGVTRGALYYHYRDKAALFKAVFEEERTALIQAVLERIQAAEGDTWQRFVVTGCHAFIEYASNPSVRRIVHTDGPAVLDWVTLQQSGPGLMLLRTVFTRLMAEGLIEEQPVESLARLAWAMLFEAAIYIGQAGDSAEAREEVLDTLLRLIAGLRLTP